LAALAFAQRAPCAAAILVRPAAEMVLFFRLDFPAAQGARWAKARAAKEVSPGSTILIATAAK